MKDKSNIDPFHSSCPSCSVTAQWLIPRQLKHKIAMERMAIISIWTYCYIVQPLWTGGMNNYLLSIDTIEVTASRLFFKWPSISVVDRRQISTMWADASSSVVQLLLYLSQIGSLSGPFLKFRIFLSYCLIQRKSALSNDSDVTLRRCS